MSRLSALLILVLSLSSGLARADLSVRTGHLSISAGYYSLNSSAGSDAQIGSYTLEYLHALTPRWQFFGGYNNVFAAGLFRSLMSGFDAGAAYCFFSCVTEIERYGEVASYAQRSPFGIAVGGGFSMRTIHGTSSSTGYLGTFVRAQTIYSLFERVSLVAKVQLSNLASGASSVRLMDFSGGLSLEF